MLGDGGNGREAEAGANFSVSRRGAVIFNILSDVIIDKFLFFSQFDAHIYIIADAVRFLCGNAEICAGN